MSTTETRIPITFIMECVCEAVGIFPHQLTGWSRQPQEVRARELLAVLARRHTSMSYPQIAMAMGKQPGSHSAIVSYYQRGIIRMRDDEQYRAMYDAIEREVLGT